ncbi:MAG: hypothetical protein AVDCRST_MAG71-2380, partial [uncultured Lysobacter sp.]
AGGGVRSRSGRAARDHRARRRGRALRRRPPAAARAWRLLRDAGL